SEPPRLCARRPIQLAGSDLSSSRPARPAHRRTHQHTGRFLNAETASSRDPPGVISALTTPEVRFGVPLIQLLAALSRPRSPFGAILMPPVRLRFTPQPGVWTMSRFEKRQRAQRAAAVAGVDAGKR